MSLPYSAVSLAAAVVLLILGAGWQVAAPLAAAGLATGAASVASLKMWKSGGGDAASLVTLFLGGEKEETEECEESQNCPCMISSSAVRPSVI